MDNLILGPSKNGKGVFARKDIRKGEGLLQIRGKRLTGKQLITPYDVDHAFQIGKDRYLGPSGKMDDYINHSCNPNTGVRTQKHQRILVAIKNIKKGKEITLDYSTFADDEGWTCNCGSKLCRKKVRSFRYLPQKIQQKYIRLGIVQAYLLEKLK